MDDKEKTPGTIQRSTGVVLRVARSGGSGSFHQAKRGLRFQVDARRIHLATDEADECLLGLDSLGGHVLGFEAVEASAEHLPREELLALLDTHQPKRVGRRDVLDTDRLVRPFRGELDDQLGRAFREVDVAELAERGLSDRDRLATHRGERSCLRCAIVRFGDLLHLGLRLGLCSLGHLVRRLLRTFGAPDEFVAERGFQGVEDGQLPGVGRVVRDLAELLVLEQVGREECPRGDESLDCRFQDRHADLPTDEDLEDDGTFRLFQAVPAGHSVEDTAEVLVRFRELVLDGLDDNFWRLDFCRLAVGELLRQVVADQLLRGRREAVFGAGGEPRSELLDVEAGNVRSRIEHFPLELVAALRDLESDDEHRPFRADFLHYVVMKRGLVPAREGVVAGVAGDSRPDVGQASRVQAGVELTRFEFTCANPLLVFPGRDDRGAGLVARLLIFGDGSGRAFSVTSSVLVAGSLGGILLLGHVILLARRGG